MTDGWGNVGVSYQYTVLSQCGWWVLGSACENELWDFLKVYRDHYRKTYLKSGVPLMTWPLIGEKDDGNFQRMNIVYSKSLLPPGLLCLESRVVFLCSHYADAYLFCLC